MLEQNNKELLVIAQEEIDTNTQVDSLWRKALALSDNDIEKASKRYLKLRIRQLQREPKTNHTRKNNSTEDLKKPIAEPIVEKKENNVKEDTGGDKKGVSILLSVVFLGMIVLGLYLYNTSVKKSNNTVVQQKTERSYIKQKNKAKTLQDYVKSCDEGNQDGCKKEVEVYTEACSYNDALRCRNLGYMYENGKGVALNYTEALKYYEKSCSLGNEGGCKNIEILNRKIKHILKSTTETKQKQVNASSVAIPPSTINIIGKALYAKCSGCHGAKGKIKALGKSAVIAGQSVGDLEDALLGYQAGIRNTQGMGMLMKGQVASLSKDDIKVVAEYIYLLGGKNKRTPTTKVIKKYPLTINTFPSDARVRIMNIKPKYYDGIRLVKGKYKIRVSKKGYYRAEGIADPSEASIYNVTLKKKDKVVVSGNYINKNAKTMSKRERDNYKQCMRGDFPALCKHSWLTASQKKLVRNAEKKYNYKQCMRGDFPILCKHSWLTASQKKLVRNAEKKYNYKQCMRGDFPTLCKHSWLTSSQASQVKKAERRAKLNRGY